MNQVANKIFSRLLTNKGLFLVLCLTLLGVLFPVKYALAAWYDFLIGAFSFIPFLLISVLLMVVVLVSNLLAAFSGMILNGVLSPSFMPWSYTNPATNPIIKLGLDIIQPFANMILVLVLVFIALATILRLAGYETKKLLVTFIIVALLVNFAPVIAGLIVDASNIVMNAFTKNITGSSLLIGNLKAMGDALVKSIDIRVFKATTQSGIVMKFVLLIVVNIILFLILLLFAFVFMVRYIAIWALVILSPLAFVAYILPATKKFASLWWSQFVLWSIIGIPMVFFLYLAEQLAYLNPVVPTGTVGGDILPSFLPIIFLYLGFAFGLSISAMGASTVITLTKRGGNWIKTKGWTGVKTWAEEKAQIREKVGTAVRAVEKVPYARVFLPEAAKKYAEFRPAVEGGREESGAYSSKVVAGRIAVGADYGVKAVGGMLTLIDRGDMQDLFQAFGTKYFGDKWGKTKFEADLHAIPEFRDKMVRLLQLGLRAGHHNTILRGDPRLARYAFEQLPGYDAATLGKSVQEGGVGDGTPEGAVVKATLEARRTHIGHWEKEVTTDEEVIRAGLTKGTEFWSAIDTQVKQGQETALKTIDKMFSAFIDSKGGLTHFGGDIDKAWGEWEDEFKTRFGPGMKGYFEAEKTDRRFTARGWRRGQYLAPALRAAPPPAAPGAPPGGGAPPTTPGAAAGLPNVGQP